MPSRILLPILIPLFILCATGSAQIPNSGFEQWAAGNPENWFTGNLPGFWTTVTRSMPGYSGSSAVMGEVITYNTTDTIAPLLASGPFGEGFAVTERYSTLGGYYMFGQVGGDIIYVSTLMYQSGTYLGGGIQFISTPSTEFIPFSVPITYNMEGTPDTCIIQIAISNSLQRSHPGSYFIIDDLTLSGTTGLPSGNGPGSPADFVLYQNYPNPFNPSTTIFFDNPDPGYVTLKVYDLLGSEVAELVAGELTAGRHIFRFDAGAFPAGTYFYQLTAGNMRKTRKMTLLK